MHTPKFWQKLNILSLALIPFSLFYLAGFFLNRLLTKTKQVNVKVICIGNLTAGGQGKTPCAVAIGKILDQLSINFAFVSRGYGAKIKSSIVEVKNDSSACEVGDEPLILVNQASTFVGKNRSLVAKILAERNLFKALILDDGLQNNNLKKDLNIVVIDQKIMFGNNLVLPAGPLRQPLGFGLKDSDLIVLIEENSQPIDQRLINKKIIRAKIFPTNLNKFLGKKIIAFCGIAYPAKFFDTLKKHQLDVIKYIAFKDHHRYNNKDFVYLKDQLKLYQTNDISSSEVILLTTKKDWVKFPEQLKSQIFYLDIELKFDDEEMIKNEIKKLFK